MDYKIMLVEDDTSLVQLLCSYLEKYGYHPVTASDFERVLDAFFEVRPHLVLLDINLPRYDGFYWCRKIRQVSKVPIILISAREGAMDQVLGLESGADDYITKPFDYEVVMAKIKSQLRRCYGDLAPGVRTERRLELAGLTLYPERPELHFEGKVVVLTKKEAVLAETLLRSAPRTASRELLMEKLWDDQAFVDENTLNVNVARLRKKLKEIGIDGALETVRGYGYRLHVTWGRAE